MPKHVCVITITSLGNKVMLKIIAIKIMENIRLRMDTSELISVVYIVK